MDFGVLSAVTSPFPPVRVEYRCPVHVPRGGPFPAAGLFPTMPWPVRGSFPYLYPFAPVSGRPLVAVAVVALVVCFAAVVPALVDLVSADPASAALVSVGSVFAGPAAGFAVGPVYWGFGSSLRKDYSILTNSLNLPALGRCHSIYVLFRVCIEMCFC